MRPPSKPVLFVEGEHDDVDHHDADDLEQSGFCSETWIGDGGESEAVAKDGISCANE